MKTTKITGFSIIEVMIAIALSVVLLGAVIQVFYANHQTSIQINGMSRMQENGRFAAEYLARKMRVIGFTSCMKSTAMAYYSSLNAGGPDLEKPIIGYDATGSSWASVSGAPTLASLGITAQAGTDAITITSVNTDSSLRVSSTHGTGTEVGCPGGGAEDLIFNKNSSFSVGQVITVSDCNTTSTFQITGLTTDATKTVVAHDIGGTAPGNAMRCLCRNPKRDKTCNYAGDGFVSRVQSTTYFIAPSIKTGTTVNKNNRGDTTLALWRKSDASAAEELVEGVENLQILYGIDTASVLADKDAQGGFNPLDKYVTGDNITNASQVRAIRFSVTTNSVDSVVAGNVVTATSPLSRRTFTQTVQLRNQSFTKTHN